MTENHSPEGRASEWLIALLVAANLLWTTLCLGGYRPETMIVSSLLTGATLAAQLAVYSFSDRKIHPSNWYLLPFLVYAAVNAAFFSPVPWLAARDWLGWAQCASVFWILTNGVSTRRPRHFLLGTLVALAALAVVLACYQRFLWPDWLMLGRKQAQQFWGRSSGPFGIPNSLAALLILLIPAAWVMTTQRAAGAVQRILCGYLLLAFLLGLGLTISRGAWISLLIALIVWPLWVREKPLEWRISAATAAATISLITGIAVYTTVPRVKQRFDALVADMGERSRPILWKGALQLWQDSPVVGTGAGSFNTLFERYRPARFNDEPQWAHNDYVNTLSDYGIVGFVLCFGGALLVARKAVKKAGQNAPAPEWTLTNADRPQVTRALAVGLLAFALSLTVDFHLHIPALAMIVAVLAAEIVLRVWPCDASAVSSPWRQTGGLVAAAGVVLGCLAVALPVYRGEGARYQARQSIDRLALVSEPSTNQQKAVLSSAASLLTEACVLHPGNGQAWADRAYGAALWARLSPMQATQLGREAEESARIALTRSKVVPEFWVRLAVALDLQGKWGEGGAALAEATRIAPMNATVWYHQAYHLSLIPAAHALSLAAVETALRLDPGYSPAIRLQKDLISRQSDR
jgi:O-antigen ligase